MEFTRRGSRSSHLGGVETTSSAVDEEPGKGDRQGAAVSEPQDQEGPGQEGDTRAGQEGPGEEGATSADQEGPGKEGTPPVVARGQQFNLHL